MTVMSARLTFCIPHAQSLKDKRAVARAVIDKTRHKFHAAVAEVDTQDVLDVLTIGAAVVSGERTHAKNMLDSIVRFMENNADAELVLIEIQED